jgi:KDO2-lipid IV(A) lauroyltransferase
LLILILKYKKVYMFFFILLSKIPFWLLYKVSDVFYFFMYYFPGYRKKVVKENLRKSFPTKNKKEISFLSKEFYSNLADLTLETLKIPDMKKDDVQERIKIMNMDLIHSYLDKGSSVIVLTGHQCNWEWLLLASSIECRYPIDAVYKPLQINFLDKLFIEMRSKFGAKPLAMKDVYRSVVRNKNEARVIAMVADQTPAHSEIQYFTNFMNQNTAFFVGADKIARHTAYPVLFLDMKRVKRGYYEAELHLLKEAPFDNTKFGVIESYARILENSINKNPSDWLWSHRRWKHQNMKIRRKRTEEDRSKEE